jgi:hypothetical protein
VGVERAPHQAHFFLQQQHFEQIAHSLGVADDVVANGIGTKTLTHDLGHGEDGQLALSVRRVACTMHLQGACIVEQAHQ